MEFEFGQDELFATPESEHTGAVIEGLLDTVNGSEGLTFHQHYCYGALMASDAVSSRVGAEGFFASVGDAINSIWEYIKKAFQSIWGFFFKREAKETEEETKEAVDKATEALKSVENPKVEVSEIKAVEKKVKEKLAKLPDTPQKKEIKAKIEQVDQASSEAEKAKKLEEVKVAIFSARMYDRTKVNAIWTDLEGAVKKLEEHEKAAHDDDDDRTGNGAAIRTFLNGLTSLPEVLKEVHNLPTAEAFLKKAPRCLEAMRNNFTALSDSESVYKRRITEIEKLIKESASDKGEKTKLNKQLKGLKADLSSILSIITLGKRVMDAIKSVSNHIKDCCVDV